MMSAPESRRASRARASLTAASSASSAIVNVLPAELDLSIYSGDTLTLNFSFTDSSGNPVDMTGTWTAQIRTNPGDPDPPLASFTVDASKAATGVVVLTLAADVSQTLPTGSTVHWDLEQTVGAAVRTTHKGTVNVTEDVTRP